MELVKNFIVENNGGPFRNLQDLQKYFKRLEGITDQQKEVLCIIIFEKAKEKALKTKKNVEFNESELFEILSRIIENQEHTILFEVAKAVNSEPKVHLDQ
jgi:hypothetical protein